MKPSIGRIVHYTHANLDGSGGELRIYAAIITDVYGFYVCLHVFDPLGAKDDLRIQDVAQAPDDVKAGTSEAFRCWQWPARED